MNASRCGASVVSGPVALKNHGPPSPSMTAPSRRELGCGELGPMPICPGCSVPLHVDPRDAQATVLEGIALRCVRRGRCAT